MTTPRTDSAMRRADSMVPHAVVVAAPMARGLESDLNEAQRDLIRMRGRIESLRGLLKTAVGMLHDSGRDADADEIHALIVDMEKPL